MYFLYLAEKKFAENYLYLQSPLSQERTARGKFSSPCCLWGRLKLFFGN